MKSLSRFYQVVFGELITVYLPVANFLKRTYAKHYESQLAVDKCIAILSECLFVACGVH